VKGLERRWAIALGVWVCFAQITAGSAQRPEGSAVKPLQITLSQSEHRFRLAFHNDGPKPLVLNLGFKFPNGDDYPVAVRLFLTGADGHTLVLQRRVPGVIGGRADAMLLKLPAGATSEMPINLADYWVPDQHIYVLHLHPGTYRLQAQYTGLDAFGQPVDHATRRNTLTPYWTGTVRSNILKLTLP